LEGELPRVYRRVKRALYGLLQGALSKDVVGRAWRKVKVDRGAWCTRSLADADIVRRMPGGTIIKTRFDRKAPNIAVLAATGVRRDGQEVLLSIKNMGGESKAARGMFLGDLDARGLKRPKLVIVGGAPGSEAALRRNRAHAIWALTASGQFQVRKVDGRETLPQPIVPINLDLAA
jgi:transposase-like protein